MLHSYLLLVAIKKGNARSSLGHVTVLAFPEKETKNGNLERIALIMYNNLNLSIKTLPKHHINEFVNLAARRSSLVIF